MKILGLAGESGTGKSTLAGYLVTRGAEHIDCDRVGHELLAHDAEVNRLVRESFGDSVFDAQGQVDRRKLGAIVFADTDALKRYGDIIHPAIRTETGRRVDAMRDRNVPLAVVDGALLLTSEMPFAYDLLIALRCDPREQVQRLLARGDRSESEVRARLDSQAGIQKSFDKADAIIDTTGDLEHAVEALNRLVDPLLHQA